MIPTVPILALAFVVGFVLGATFGTYAGYIRGLAEFNRRGGP